MGLRGLNENNFREANLQYDQVDDLLERAVSD